MHPIHYRPAKRAHAIVDRAATRNERFFAVATVSCMIVSAVLMMFLG